MFANAFNCKNKFILLVENLLHMYNFGEIHIYLNQYILNPDNRYGTARKTVTNVHICELQQIVDSHPEYYLNEFVSALACVTGKFYHPSTISRIL